MNAVGVVLLNDLRMTIESKSYIDAMHGILTYKGWTANSKSMLAGMTVTGFRFTVNRHLTAESATAYNWIAENFLAGDFLGITSSQCAGYHFDATFPLYQEQAISQIKQSVSRGLGAVIWQDRFVIAAGYDDQRQALYISDGMTDEYKLLPYADFGCCISPYWYYQVFEDRIDIDEMEIYKESLLQAVYKWEAHDPMLPNAEYACGRLAYDAIITAIRQGDYDQEGAGETISCYASAKRDIASYTDKLKQFWPQLGEIAVQYARTADLFGRAAEMYTASTRSMLRNSRPINDMTDLFLEAQQAEEQAIQSIRLQLRETIGNRFNDIALR